MTVTLNTKSKFMTDDVTINIPEYSIGENTLDATLNNSNQLLSNVTAYSQGIKYTGTIPIVDSGDCTINKNTITIPQGYFNNSTTVSIDTISHPLPSILFNGATGLITATHTQDAGYVEADSSQMTLLLDTQNATTYYPSTDNQIINAQQYLLGNQTIKAVEYSENELIAENIKTGVTITIGDEDDSDRLLSVTGSYTSDATLISDNQLLSGVTAYSNGTKYIGTIPTVLHNVPTISIDTTTGVITATHSQNTGYVVGDNKNAELTLTTVNGTTITPTETAQTIISANRYTLGDIVLSPISSSYIGSDIVQRTSADITINGAEITIPVGYYNTEINTSVATTTHPAPTLSLNTTTGVVTATHAQTAGYTTGGTATDTYSLNTIAGATITPTESQQTIVVADRYTLGDIILNPISDTYIGSSIIQRDNTDITINGANITIPSGYYNAEISTSVNTATHTAPTLSLDTTTGIITATHIQSAGYTSGGTTTDTYSLVTASGTTITPTESQQTIITANKYTLGDIILQPISSTYIGSEITQRDNTDITINGANITIPAGYYDTEINTSVNTTTHELPTLSIDTTTGVITATHAQTAGYVSNDTKNATLNLTTQAGATITPTVTNQTAIAANTYALGTITVLGDANLIAENIKKDIVIFGVTGTAEGSGETYRDVNEVSY